MDFDIDQYTPMPVAYELRYMMLKKLHDGKEPLPDIEGRDETSPLVPRQLSVAGSQVLTEDQARMYQQMAGGHFKRKEPEGGWDGYKRPSWQ